MYHFGNHRLISENGHAKVVENGFWQGTVVYLETLVSTKFC